MKILKSIYKLIFFISVSFLSAITTPAACVATFLLRPSSFNDRSTKRLTLLSSLINFCNLGSTFMVLKIKFSSFLPPLSCLIKE